MEWKIVTLDSIMLVFISLIFWSYQFSHFLGMKTYFRFNDNLTYILFRNIFSPWKKTNDINEVVKKLYFLLHNNVSNVADLISIAIELDVFNDQRKNVYSYVFYGIFLNIQISTDYANFLYWCCKIIPLKEITRGLICW